MVQERKKGQGRKKKYSDQDIENLGQSLCDFCERKEVFHLVQWTRDQKKSYDWWTGMMENYPKLSSYHKRAKEILGGKIVQLAFENGNPWAIQTFVPMYLKDVQKHQDDQFERRAIATEKAKMLAENKIDERTKKLLDKMDKFIEADRD